MEHKQMDHVSHAWDGKGRTNMVSLKKKKPKKRVSIFGGLSHILTFADKNPEHVLDFL